MILILVIITKRRTVKGNRQSSATGHQLVVPSYRLNSWFSVLGPRLWNSLPRLLRDTDQWPQHY